MRLKFFIIVSLSGLLLTGPCYGERRRSAAHAPATQDQADTQPAPAPPPTLAESPASPPQVSFQGGQLTISAQNSTLGDILKAVRTQTGATVDLPGTAPERVVGHFGPAPPRDVLTALLNGSHFNYVLLGSPTDPGALDRVILMAKSGGADSPQPLSAQANAYNQAIYNRPTATPMAAPMAPAPGGNTVTVEGQDAEETTDDSADATDDAQADDQTDQTDQAQGDDQAAADDQQQQDGQNGQQNVKTPEQLLQELQQRQQQMQQQGIQPGVPPGMRPFPTPGGPPQPGGDGSNPPAPPHN